MGSRSSNGRDRVLRCLASRGRGVSAFTLTELLVVVGVISTVMICLVLYQVSGHRQSLSLDFQAAAIQSYEILVARLQEDFECLMPGPLSQTFSEPVPAQAVALRVVSSSMGANDVPIDSNQAVITDRVVYSFDPKSHWVFRNNQPLRAGPFESVQFTFFPSRPGDPTPPYGDTLILKVTIVPSEALNSGGVVTQRAAFEVMFHSPQGTANHVWEVWAGDRL